MPPIRGPLGTLGPLQSSDETVYSTKHLVNKTSNYHRETKPRDSYYSNYTLLTLTFIVCVCVCVFAYF